MSLWEACQIYERQLVEGTITVPFQEARKVVDRLVTAAESVVYTPFAAVSLPLAALAGYRLRPSRDFPKVRCVSRLLYTRLTAQNLLNSQTPWGWQWSHAKGTHPFSRAYGAISIRREVRVFSQWEEIFPRVIQGILSDH